MGIASVPTDIELTSRQLDPPALREQTARHGQLGVSDADLELPPLSGGKGIEREVAGQLPPQQGAAQFAASPCPGQGQMYGRRAERRPLPGNLIGGEAGCPFEPPVGLVSRVAAVEAPGKIVQLNAALLDLAASKLDCKWVASGVPARFLYRQPGGEAGDAHPGPGQAAGAVGN